MAGRTQEALYSKIDLELSWSEAELPQVQRTKHVHGLHPYLGKYVPQLVKIFLDRFFLSGQRVFDPFVGSGTRWHLSGSLIRFEMLRRSSSLARRDQRG